MSLFDIYEPGKNPMVVGGSSFGLDSAIYLQHAIESDDRHPEEVVIGLDQQTFERTLPVATLAIKRFES